MKNVLIIDHANKDYKIRFLGKEYITILGAITTHEDFLNFNLSYAHIMPDGRVMRFGEQIGTVDDVIVLEELGEYYD